MRTPTLFTLGLVAARASAQGNLASLLATRPELSTLLDFINLTGLNSTLSTASNITIVAPTIAAFAAVDPTILEGEVISNRNSTSVAALLVNHVFNGSYPASLVGEVPTFAQTRLTPEYQNERQPFTDIPGGNYNGLVCNGETVQVLSGEFTVSNVLEADLRLGKGIVIHIIDTALSFCAPPLLFAAREGYGAFSGAIEAANVSQFFGLTDSSGADEASTDLTFFIPQNVALEAIGSVLAGADTATLADVIEYHLIPNNMIFSPSIGNISVASQQGGELQFTVLDDSSIFVDDAKVILPNILLSNGVGHVIDNVLNPALPPPPRSAIDFTAPTSDRVAYPSATSVSALPLTSSLSFGSEVATAVSVPAIFTTAPLIAMNTTTTVGSGSSGVLGPCSTGVIPQTGAAAVPTFPAMPLGVGLLAGGFMAAL